MIIVVMTIIYEKHIIVPMLLKHYCCRFCGNDAEIRNDRFDLSSDNEGMVISLKQNIV